MIDGIKLENEILKEVGSNESSVFACLSKMPIFKTCCTLLCVRSGIAIILMGKRELVALLGLSIWCLVMVGRLFLGVPRGCLQFVVLVFPDHTHYFWSKKQSAVERAVRTTSDTFGPAGDHHSVRDRSEAYCIANGVKSLIGNYRDNQFNAIFQTSAELFIHRPEFLCVLETVSVPNLKLKAVKSDLECNTICTMLKCLGPFLSK